MLRGYVAGKRSDEEYTVMKVRIIPAYIGWVDISEKDRGRELYYKSIVDKNRNTDKNLYSLTRVKGRILRNVFIKTLIKINPIARNFKFRNYLNNNKKDRLWILDRIVKELLDRLDYIYCYDEIKAADINYYVNWHAFRKKTDGIDVAFFTHFEDGQKEDFVSVAGQVDYAVCMSKKYKNFLEDCGMSNVSVIRVGVDTDFFVPKLILGYVGGLYSNRKGLDLLDSLSQLDWVELRLTNGKLPYKELPNFYRQLDYVIVPSLHEGGPMSLIEGLSCGIPVIAPKDVGAVQEYNEGIIHYDKGNFSSLESVLRRLYEKKLELRRQIEEQTWDNFAKKHDELFKSLILKNQKRK